MALTLTLTRPQTRWILATTAGLAILALLWLTLGPSFRDRRVAVPPAGASPVEVVRAYVDALDAHDSETQHALMTPDMADASSWADDMGDVRLLDVAGPFPEDGESCVGAGGGREVVGVSVDLDIDWRWLRPNGEDGPRPWGYSLTRDSPADPWLICGDGKG